MTIYGYIPLPQAADADAMNRAGETAVSAAKQSIQAEVAEGHVQGKHDGDDTLKTPTPSLPQVQARVRVSVGLGLGLG